MIFAYHYRPYAAVESSTDPLNQWRQSADRVYQDIQDRHQLQQMVQDCRQNPQAVDVVLVYQLADLGESLQAVSDRLAEFSQLNIPVRVAAEAVVDSALDSSALDSSALNPPALNPSALNPPALDTPALGSPVDAEALSSGLQLAQAIEQQQRRQRIQQGHAKTRIQGQPPPGKAPYGYRRGPDRYSLDRSAATVVRAFFDHFLLYGSLRGAVRHLAEVHRKTISVSTGNRWLSSPVYRGDLAYHNGDVIPNTHAPILSRDEAAQIDRVMRRNRQFRPRTSTAPRSLAGLVVCGRCQTPMTVGQTTCKRGRQRIKTYLYLRPSHCPYGPQSNEGNRCVSLPYAEVLERTIARICSELAHTVGQSAPPPVEAIKMNLTHQIAEKQHILAQLGPLKDQGILDEQTSTLRAYRLQTEIAALQAKVGQLPPASLLSITQTVSLPQFWLDLSETERRFYFREFIQQISLTQSEDDWALALTYRF
ncbi:MAG: recombinase family protein [Elainellaceae cyanobacterium]